MSNIDLLRMSLGNLWRRRLRTLLTILGVVIGCASIIVMLSLGFGMKASNEKTLKEMGDLEVIRLVTYPTSDNATNKDAKVLDDKTVAYVKSIEHVKSVLPMLEVKIDSLFSKKYQTWAEVYGVDPEAFASFGYKVKWGRIFEPGEEGAVAIFGGQISQSWNDPNSRHPAGNIQDPTKSPVNLEKDRIEMGIGANYDEQSRRTTYKKSFKIKPIGEMDGNDWRTAYSIFVPISFAEKINRDAKKIRDQAKLSGEQNFGRKEGKKNKYSTILVLIDDIKYVSDINDRLKNEGYGTESSIQYIEALNRGVKSQQKILGGIGAVSLLVAAIGIANTMVMSIYERIREIGIMKVIGASVKDIKKLFLTEAALIGLFGGALGIGVSYAISAILNYSASKGGQDGDGMIMGGMMMGSPDGSPTKISIIPLWLVGTALVFSALIGIVSGYYPAKKATALSALDAIRTQ